MRKKIAAGTAGALCLAAMLATQAYATHGQPGKLMRLHAVYGGGLNRTFAPGFPSVRSTFGGRCSVPSDFTAAYSGAGLAGHGGRITVEGSECDRVDLATRDVEFSDGEFVVTAANGDTVLGNYTNGQGNALVGLFTYDWTFDGGTGRFANVTGHGTGLFHVLNPLGPDPRPFVDTVDGVWSYDASDRRH